MAICTFLGKYILYLFNLLCLISSVGILSIAFIINQKLYKWSNFISTDFITTPQILLAIGVGLLIISIIGLCGVLRDIGWLLTLFSVLLTIVLIGELILSGFVYQMRNEIKDYALNQMNHTISGYNKTGYEASTQTWNLIQSDIECCGIYGPEDWKLVTPNKLPTSCCYAIPLDGFCTETESYKDGCFKKFESILQENSEIIIWTAIGFALVQLFAVFLACCRKCSLHKEYETV
uniref:Tetraspanin n=1 Tax=Schizaphis graminum TaxID=13262 RepID=A0A2S2N8D1_SCHGA